jgi:hypothetical protein
MSDAGQQRRQEGMFHDPGEGKRGKNIVAPPARHPFMAYN